MKTQADSTFYLIGYNYGSGLYKNRSTVPGDSVNLDLVAAGFVEGVKGNDSKIDVEDIQGFINNYFMAAQKKQAEENLVKAEDFLAENAKRPGVTSLMDGKLQYEILKEGDGPKPTADDQVDVDYVGTLIDGTEFDSSIKRGQPATFGVKGVIKGWTEILQLMPVGSKWKVYIHPDLAYGARGNQSIPGNSALIFEMELIDIKK
ncbi:FKBP-type peptidyl-prolyl cis-trans isomerase [Saccharicrinis sp. FJH2]|uniref:FKBP-type peptidyl-prolyl cis-trans isomerase n=1 Tax=Saccharicrinis sp. FJH65 TaxID=3344659 RepID=UPI0035F48968